MIKIRVSWLVAALGVAALVSAQSWRELPKNFLHLVEADFGKGADHPLSKLKFNLFSLSRGEQVSRDLYRLIPELNIDTVRIASDFNNVVSGTPGKLTYDFKAMNSVIANSSKLDVQALMYFYPMPPPIENPAAGAEQA